MKIHFVNSSLSLLLVISQKKVSAALVNLKAFVESINTVEESFPDSDCAVVEGALGNEICAFESGYPRKLLRFSTGVWNLGPDDLEVSRQDNLDDFEFGSCHNHWHFKDFTLYELINEDTNEIVTGRKQAFCLMDIRKMDSTVGSSQYGCSNQGITAGWADIYSYYLDGQWIDITGVPAGSYTLRVTINHGGLLNETNYTDNTDTVSSSEDSDLVITQQFPCNGGPPEPTSQPSESSQPTVPPSDRPTGTPTTPRPMAPPTPLDCAVFTKPGDCKNFGCTWTGNGNNGSCSGSDAPDAPAPTDAPDAPAPTDAPVGACTALGEGCASADECCSSICQHNPSPEELFDVTRYLKGRKLVEPSGTCVCISKNDPDGQGCTANFECCSLNCNQNNDCKGSDQTDPFGIPL